MRTKPSIPLLASALASALTSAMVIILAACNTPAGDITVRDAWARPTAAQAQPTATAAMGASAETSSTNGMGAMGTGAVSAAYMTIDNKTSAADRLVSITTSVADVAQVHQTVQTGDGMTAMQQVQGGLEIPANASVELKPGGYHVMIMKLHQDLVAGQRFSMTLTFQSGKQIIIDVPVKAAQ